MLISQAFPRRFATADDIGSQTPTLHVARVTSERVGPAEKPVVWFFNARKGIVLSATLARQIAALYGDDTDAWAGKPVTLHTVPIRRMDGTRGLSIRARAPQAQDTTSVAKATNGVALRNPSQSVHCTPIAAQA